LHQVYASERHGRTPFPAEAKCRLQTEKCWGRECSPPCCASVVKQIFIATMIGSWEKECKDVHAVSFSDSSRSTDEFLGVAEFEGLVRGGEEKSKPEPFTHRRVRHPREFQSCLKQTPVPRGRVEQRRASAKDERLLQWCGRIRHPPGT
jgi:hypothetical protein